MTRATQLLLVFCGLGPCQRASMRREPFTFTTLVLSGPRGFNVNLGS